MACGKGDYTYLEEPIEIVIIDRGDSIIINDNGDTIKHEHYKDTIKYANKKEIITDFNELSYDNILIEKAFVIEKHDTRGLQGIAIHEDYLLQTYDTKRCIDVYDLNSNQFVFSMKQQAEGHVHCNNVDFGKLYEPTDPFPLLYLEYRGENTRTAVYRIVNKTGAFELERIQTLYFSSCISCITNNDSKNSEMYVTFRNNNHPADTISVAKIDIPDFLAGNITVDLESAIVKEKFDIYRNKVNQDATIYNNKLFQLKGYSGSGEIWIYDLINHKTILTIEWNKVGMTGEPEGIAWYKDHLVVTNGNGQVYNVYFVK